jgi:rSAM/selenodomain-associated transferase 1
MTSSLLVVAKRPAPGQTKTRLSPPLSPEQAAGLYECFLRDTLDLMRQTAGVERRIAYLPEHEEAYFRALAPDFSLLLQQGGDLGQRLDNALTHCLAGGDDKAVIMDSDSPSLPAACLGQAFGALDSADVVLGPCEDGGYYLIGLKRPAPRLLREVTMSTAAVLADTLRLAEAEGLRAALLPAWYDVDTAAELSRLQADLPGLPPERAPHTRRFLARLRRPPLPPKLPGRFAV